jgi:long-subunit fatty acid transport protein
MKKLVPLILLLLLSTYCYGQRYYDPEASPTFFDRTYFGGNFSFQFGDLTIINVSPLMGYMVNPRLSIGPGITYQYLKGEAFDYFTGQVYSYDSNIFGLRAFARYNITPMFFAHTEYESMKVDYPNEFGPGLVNGWVPGFFIGGGVFQPVGGRAGLGLSVLLNVIHDDIKSPYNSNLIIRAGVTL